jgi:uncharacterized Zn-finger protein
LHNLEGFECSLWQNKNDPGIFDESGYEIDHVIEFSVTQNNSESNLQALCRVCHRKKTNIFMQKLRKKTIKAKKSHADLKITNVNVLREGNKSVKHHTEAESILRQKQSTKTIVFTRGKSKHICNKCNSQFSRKSGLTYHTDNDVCMQKQYKCTYCVGTFTTESSMYRHMRKSCKEKDRNIIKNDDKRIIKELIELRRDIEYLKQEKKLVTFDDIIDMVDNAKCEKTPKITVTPTKKKRKIAPRNGRKRKMIARKKQIDAIDIKLDTRSVSKFIKLNM